MWFKAVNLEDLFRLEEGVETCSRLCQDLLRGRGGANMAPSAG